MKENLKVFSEVCCVASVGSHIYAESSAKLEYENTTVILEIIMKSIIILPLNKAVIQCLTWKCNP
jgi:hypothetical protein